MTQGVEAGSREELHKRLRARLAASLVLLPDKPEETVEATLAALWLAAAGTPASASASILTSLPALDAPAVARLHALVEARLAGRPLAYLTGRQRFMGVELEAAPDALIPRAETEVLARAAIALLGEAGKGPSVAVDACTGSGNVAIAVAAAVPRCRIFAADLSPGAVALARRNVERCSLADRVTVELGDLLAPFSGPDFNGRVDLVTCNPPYISSPRLAHMAAEIADHEPRMAFDGGPLGIRILTRIVEDSAAVLRAGGWLALEVGHGQARGVASRVERTGHYDALREWTDAAGVVRAIGCRRKAHG